MSSCAKTGIKYECSGASARGVARRENQDRYRISDTGIVLCDGIGGADAGGVFAEASCWQCDRLLTTGMQSDEIVDSANSKIAAIGGVLGSRGGSSVCIAKFNEDGSVDISSRGDVLAFRVNRDDVSVINYPDYASEMELEAFLGDGRRRPFKSQRYCATPLSKSDECLVLLSDGVWNNLAASDLVKTWRLSNGDVRQAAKQLVRLAGKYGSVDDRTAVVCSRVA